MDDRIIIDPRNAQALKRMRRATSAAHDPRITVHPAVIFDALTQKKVLQLSRLDEGAIKAGREANKG